MTLPIVAKSWIITPNNRILFVSVADTTQNLLFGWKAFLKTNGYTVKGSASGGTGAMDGVDRWTNAAAVTPRGALSSNSQAWIVLTDGNGADISICWQGNADEQARIAFSPTGIYVAAGTPQNQPTAADEQAFITGNTTIHSASTSADRVWFGWVSSDKKACRFVIARGGVWVGQLWGVEPITSVVTTTAQQQTSPTIYTPPLVGFGYASSGNLITSPAQVGLARSVVASVIFSMSLRFGFEEFANAFQWSALRPPMQGGLGVDIWPLSVASFTVGAEGKIGNLIDWWVGKNTGGNPGDTYFLKFIAADSGGVLWPWDGSTIPVLT